MGGKGGEARARARPRGRVARRDAGLRGESVAARAVSSCSAACGEGERKERGKRKERKEKRKEMGMEERKVKWERRKNEEGDGDWVCAGGDCGVCGPGKACAAWRADQGRQRRVRPAIIAVGEKEKVESTNGIGSWESGVRDREKIFES